MSEPANTSEFADLPQARIGKSNKGPSLIWLIPIIAIAVGGWLIYKTLAEQGSSITIVFPTAEGLEAGKTRVKYLDVDLGVIETIRLSNLDNKVEAIAKLARGTESKLTSTTQFWVVKPRLESTRVSGLSTLLTGAYVGMDPGAGGEPQDHFIGLDGPPKVLSHRKGTLYQLRAETLGSVSLCAPVLFRQFKVGDVISSKLADDHTHVNIEVFIDEPHDRYVTKSSSFWNVSGVEIDARSDGVKLQMESLSTVLIGGIAFDYNFSIHGNKQAPEGTVFTLYDSERESKERPIKISYPYIAYFDDSVRGLTIGAEVEFRGIRIGEVVEITPEIDDEKGEVRIATLLAIEPERFRETALTEKESIERIKRMIANGLRAQLKTGNLITGQLFVDMDFYPLANPARLTMRNDIPVIPTMPSPIKDMTQKLSSVLSKLDNLPIEEIGKQVEQTAAGANRLVNNKDLAEAMSQAKELVTNLNQQTMSLMKSANQTLAGTEKLVQDLTKTTTQLDQTLQAFEDLTSENGPIGSELLRMLAEFSDAARSTRSLVEYLQRNPEALLQGKTRP